MPTIARNAARSERSGSRVALYTWTFVILAVGVVAVVLGWHAHGGAADPTDPGVHMGPTAAVINSAVLVFREALECILVLAAVTASFLGKNRSYRRPVALGGAAGLVATVATWFMAIWLIGMFGGTGLSVQEATGMPAFIILLIVMNWFFHKIYWTVDIAPQQMAEERGRPRHRHDLATDVVGVGIARFHLGLPRRVRGGDLPAGLRERFGSSVVLEGVLLGMLFTVADGVLTFVLHERLPYKKMLTGGLLVVVLWVMVGEQVNEMQLAGWIGTTDISGLNIPGWAGTRFSVFPNVETFVGQGLAIGSYVGAQYLRVWRPRWRGDNAARIGTAPTAHEPVEQT